MGEDCDQTGPVRYRAFISYSHADARFAAWLHRKLEQWSSPGQPRLSPIFIDRAELAAGPDLSASVREALAGSAALIVLASPAARASHWVGQEIALFRELHPDRPLLAALLGGEPGEAFPEPLLSHRGQAFEPLAADFREGHDGKRLALLKIVAGLAALPLDRLVQRDAQSRQRRVMWITAGALLLSLVLAAMLVVALRARTEAEHQRAEAEGMVEFMLTDLRDKLKGVGRLDIMDAVNERAMAHYQTSGDQDGLSDESLRRRAHLLLAMGEDYFDTKGGRARGREEIATAWKITGRLIAQAPNDPENVFWHAQSEYWMGYAAFSTSNDGSNRDLAGASDHWSQYARLAKHLVQIQPSQARSFREIAYSEGALCGLAMQGDNPVHNALPHCRDARVAMERASLLDGNTASDQLDLASRLAWEADANAADSNLDTALALRQRQLGIVEHQLRLAPDNAEIVEADMLANMGMAKLLRQRKQLTQARSALQRANELVAQLIARDPTNRNWSGWRTQIIADLNRLTEEQ